MKGKKAVKTTPPTIITQPKNYNNWLLVLLIVITSAVYFKSTQNEFTNWDDRANIIDNKAIQTLHGDSIGYTLRQIFGTSINDVMYAPLTALTYAIEYSLFKINPTPYHINNLLLHLLNCVLVFYFIRMLTQQQWVAFITALLFGIHPMHVESVAWVTGRIDLLYTLFYLGALCLYIFFLKQGKWTWYLYLGIFLLFAFSLLSKVMAVTLPLAFFALDYFNGRKLTSKTVLEKAPFFLLALVFGYMAIDAQKASLVLGEGINYGFLDKFLFTCYAVVMYLWKLIAPVNLTCSYEFPLKEDGMYPAILYISPFIIIVLLFLIYQSKRWGKDVIFGFAFFAINIALILPGVSPRSQIMADRYTYLSYLGLFFIVGRWINLLIENSKGKLQPFRIPLISVFVLFLVVCSYLTVQRTKVWHDSISLWTAAIENYDGRIFLAYKNRGNAFVDAGKYEEAIKDFNTLFSYTDIFKDAYAQRAIAYACLGKYDIALNDYSAAIEYKPGDYMNYLNRGIAYGNLGKHDEAAKDFTSVIQYSPKDDTAYFNRGIAYSYLGKHEEAISDFTTVMQYRPKDDTVYFRRGISFALLGKHDEAIRDYGTAITINPGYGQVYYYRAATYLTIQKFQPALEDVLKAKELGFEGDPKMMQAIQDGIRNTR